MFYVIFQAYLVCSVMELYYSIQLFQHSFGFYIGGLYAAVFALFAIATLTICLFKSCFSTRVREFSLLLFLAANMSTLMTCIVAAALCRQEAISLSSIHSCAYLPADVTPSVSLPELGHSNSLQLDKGLPYFSVEKKEFSYDSLCSSSPSDRYHCVGKTESFAYALQCAIWQNPHHSTPSPLHACYCVFVVPKSSRPPNSSRYQCISPPYRKIRFSCLHLMTVFPALFNNCFAYALALVFISFFMSYSRNSAFYDEIEYNDNRTTDTEGSPSIEIAFPVPRQTHLEDIERPRASDCTGTPIAAAAAAAAAAVAVSPATAVTLRPALAHYPRTVYTDTHPRDISELSRENTEGDVEIVVLDTSSMTWLSPTQTTNETDVTVLNPLRH